MLQPIGKSHKNEQKSINKNAIGRMCFCCVAQERCCHGTAFLGVAHAPAHEGLPGAPRTPPSFTCRRQLCQ